jgi:hypothetical protein
VSYGNYIRIPASVANAHTITVRISRPGTSRTIRAKFDFPH